MKQLIYVMVLAFAYTSVYAQDAPLHHLTFNHMALSVKDVNKSAAFYSEVLGLQEITNRTQIQGIRWFSIGEGRELHLISIVNEPVTINKAVHLALTSDNFDLILKQLEEHHITYSDWPGVEGKVNIRTDGIKQIFFQDPDGYWLEVNSVGQK